MNSSKFTSVENTVTGHAKEAKPDKQKMDDREWKSKEYIKIKILV